MQFIVCGTSLHVDRNFSKRVTIVKKSMVKCRKFTHFCAVFHDATM